MSIPKLQLGVLSACVPWCDCKVFSIVGDVSVVCVPGAGAGMIPMIAMSTSGGSLAAA